MGLVRRYSLRLERKRRLIRAARKGLQLSALKTRLTAKKPGDIILVATVRNEAERLPYFLNYYRALGVNHFLFVENDGTDGTAEYLAGQPDVSVWQTKGSYKRASFGIDWVNRLLNKYCVGHWVVVVDVDEFLVYPHCDTRPLKALTDWLDASSIRSFGTMLLDMYARTAIDKTFCARGENPFRKAPYFDAGNYQFRQNKRYGNLWIQGGPRQRVFFPDLPHAAPALNKIPLVKWQRGAVFVSSTHSLLPRSLNLVYDETGGERICGLLLHAKFLSDLKDKAREEQHRKQHYASSREYRAYGRNTGRILWTAQSTQYQGWRQLEELGLMSSGDWI